MSPLAPIHKLFETWIDPFSDREDQSPPTGTWAFFWFFFNQAKLVFLTLLVLGAVIALIEAAMFYFVGRLVDLLTASDPGEGVAGLVATHGWELLGMLGVVLVVRFLCLWIQAMVEEQTVNYGFFNLVRWQSFTHVARQSLGFFQNEFSGSVSSKVWSGGAALGDFAVSVVQKLWFVVVYTVTTMALVFYLDWRLAALVLVWVVLFAVLARHFIPRIRKLSAGSAEQSAALTGRIVDSFSNIMTLKLFGSAQANNRYVRRGFSNYLDALSRLVRTVTSLRGSMAFLSGAAISAIALLSVQLWAEGAITVGAVTFTLGLVLRLNAQLDRLMNQLNGLMRNFGVAQNSAELISRPLGLVDRPDAQPLQVAHGAIRFEDVSFHYGKPGGIISHLDLSIAPGERIGLVGQSGAGKSTLMNLLLRFYDLEDGRITIDGQDISCVTQESLRANIGVVTQDTALLHRSIRANLRYGRPEASDAEIIAAAESAEAHGFIVDLSDNRGRRGYDAHVGERGVKLSGGQRQRLAIGRVLLKDAPILVLDEATSALDSEVEAAIQSQLESLMAGKTVIAIAHRLSTIAAMDRLVVLDKGAIVEQGTHAELLRLDGHYARLWHRQSGGFLDAREFA
jgi:ATP-binding cassette subfamily B multidrug efflux pump